VIELIEKGLVTNNRFYVDTDLVGAFQENWRLLVNTLHQSDFTQPFYYLQSEKIDARQIWYLQPKPGCQINAHIKSVTRLVQVLDFGYFDERVFLLLMNAGTRGIIKTLLLDTFFQYTKTAFLSSKAKGEGYIHDLEAYLLNESVEQYHSLESQTEEDVFVRGGLFKKLVPKVYDSTCSFTGMRLESIFGHSYIDACHIVPFSISHDDKVSNGLALCPNLHRAFDRGLITLNQDFTMLVSDHVTENQNHPYSLKQLNGRKMRLPFGENYYPALENIKWHRENVFK
jgi:putative restriction endonuclease